MAVNYDDERFAKVESEKQEVLNNANKTYDDMINQTDAKYNELIDATKDYADKQQELQQKNTDFTIEQVNQQKEQAEKDYIKEQKGAYTDYQKTTNQYGVNAEQQAKAGLTNTGYSESSKINAYTTYQNRYSSAREVYNKAILNFDNAIKDAQLKNNATLAEIAFKALQTELEYALQGFQYRNNLLQTKLNTQIQLDSEYNNRYQQVLAQINTENNLAEQIRQYNESMAYQKQRDAISDAQWQKQYNLSVANSKSSGSTKLSNGSTSSSSSSSLKNSSNSTNTTSSTKKSTNSSSKNDILSGLVKGVSKNNTHGNNNEWISARELANSLGLPAAVNLSKIISDKEYEEKEINGFTYYRKK